MIEADEVVQKLDRRRMNQQDSISRMAAIRDAYHGDVIVPLPEVEESEAASVANLLNQGLEQLALRISSVTPDVICPPRDESKKSEQRAAKNRRRAIFGWWEATQMDMKMGQRARHLLGYSQSYAWVRWNPKSQVPMWRICDPLATFPSDAFIEDHVNTYPSDCIGVYVRRLGDLWAMYPENRDLRIMLGRAADPDTMVEVAEYADEHEYVMVAIGTRHAQEQRQYAAGSFGGEVGGMRAVEIERYENRAHMVPVGCAVRQGLDRPMSKFEGMLGMYQMQSRLMALEILAVERGIFPEMWAVARPGETVKVITPADGLRGIMGELQGGEIREIQTNPGFMTNPTIDRLERNQRVTAGIPSDFGGESASNIRTGRRGDAVLSATVDFPIQESQRMLARSMQYENKVAIALAKAYGGNVKKSFYVSWKGSKGWADYTPSIDFTTDENIVSYASPGADLNDLVVGGGQRLGMRTMSKQRFMELDPLIEDPEREFDLVTAEALDAVDCLGTEQEQVATVLEGDAHLR